MSVLDASKHSLGFKQTFVGEEDCVTNPKNVYVVGLVEDGAKRKREEKGLDSQPAPFWPPVRRLVLISFL